MIQDPAAFVSTDFQRAVTTGLFASCAALVARGGVGIEMAGDGGDPRRGRPSSAPASWRTGSPTWAPACSTGPWTITGARRRR